MTTIEAHRAFAVLLDKANSGRNEAFPQDVIDIFLTRAEQRLIDYARSGVGVGNEGSISRRTVVAPLVRRVSLPASGPVADGRYVSFALPGDVMEVLPEAWAFVASAPKCVLDVEFVTREELGRLRENAYRRTSVKRARALATIEDGVILVHYSREVTSGITRLDIAYLMAPVGVYLGNYPHPRFTEASTFSLSPSFHQDIVSLAVLEAAQEIGDNEVAGAQATSLRVSFPDLMTQSPQRGYRGRRDID